MNRLTEFPYTHVLVLGLAKSGTAAANMLLDNGVNVRVNDKNGKTSDRETAELIEKGADVITGEHPLSVLDDIELVVKNPGISYEHPLMQEAARRELPIVTEIELAGNLAGNSPIIGITGSNGKTTTTTLVEAMLRESKRPVKIAGNIGVVATDVARTLEKKEMLLLELSSFQLMGIDTFRPKVAALLNLHGAHLDYHGTLDHYMQAKANIFKNQTKEDFLVYNADDARVCQIIQHAQAQLIPFSTSTKQPEGAWTDGVNLYFKETLIIRQDEVVLVGGHNTENILAAISIAMTMGATVGGIRQVLVRFSGVEHRLQFVKEVNGRQFYNDSKATNMLATEMALKAFDVPTILLAGGLDRGDTFEELIPYLGHVKAMVLFGETREKLQQLAQKQGIETRLASDVSEAATEAFHMSAAGDVILLSPACASWDQYKTFEERGDMFTRAVHTLA